MLPFYPVWIELRPQFQNYLVAALLSALESPNIPPEILQALLNLAEYMEHDDKALPIDIYQLSALASKCHAYAKALHYKELESASSDQPHLCTESLISINNKLGQPEAARGILMHARQRATKAGQHIQMEVSWFEKLGQWDDALALYADKLDRQPNSIEFMVGRIALFTSNSRMGRISRTSSRRMGNFRTASKGRTRKRGKRRASQSW